MRFAKLNKPPLSFKPPSLLSPPSKVLEKNKPPPGGGLNRGFTVVDSVSVTRRSPLRPRVRGLNREERGWCLVVPYAGNNKVYLRYIKVMLHGTIHNDDF